LAHARRAILPILLLLLPAALFAAPALHVGPYLQNVDGEGAGILWETTDPVVGEVEVTAEGQGPRRAADKGPATFHELRVAGLEAGARYTYRISWPGFQSDAYSFRTAPPPGTRHFRLVAYGDTRTDPAVHAAIAARIAAEKPDLVVHAGDLVADGRNLAQWKPQFFDPAAALLREVCLWPVLGNHERNSEHYYRYFALPGNEAWYAFEYADARFLALDSQQACEPGSAQYRWLEEQLAREHKGWTIVLLHAPLFSVHPTRPISTLRWSLEPLFQKCGVDLVLAGHDHHYGRSYPVGPAFDPGRPVHHFTVGGGGAPLYPVEMKPWAAVVKSTYNYLVLDFDGDRVAGRALDDKGAQVDAFAIDRTRPVPAAELFAWEPAAWEHAIADAAAETPPSFVEGDTADVQMTLRLPPAPGGSVRGEVTWQDTGGRWRFAPATAPLAAERGRDVTIPVRARCRASEMYPPPGGTLRITGGDPAWTFRNTTVALPPLRVAPRRSLRVPAAAAPPQVDGRLDDACWADALVQDGFVRADGAALARTPTRFRLAADGNCLYLAAQVPLGAALNTAPKDEALVLRVGTGRELHELGVNGEGALTCTRSGDATWKPGAQAAAAAAGGEWAVEMSVPLAALGLAPGAEVRLNVEHYDAGARERSEWAPTFGHEKRAGWYGTALLPAR